jgi:hypothetical protein
MLSSFESEKVPMQSSAVTVRRAELADAPALQAIYNEVIAEGTFFTAEVPKSLDDTIQLWLTPPVQAYVACDSGSGELLGAYVLRPNMSGRGSHIANASYMVARRHKGRGLGLGFARIGTVPQAFRLPSGEYVDTYIMYRSLLDGSQPG